MNSDLEIIAEIHPQHGGTAGGIRELIREAKIAGADSVKLQLYDGPKLLGPAWSYLTIDESQLSTIKRWCEQESLTLGASVFDVTRLEWCIEHGITDLKVASITLRDDRALCDRIIEASSRVTISLGYWTESGLPYPPGPDLRYLYCKSSYPALLEDMTDFPLRFEEGAITGYSDHTLGLGVPLLAIARGASVIEKHMTLDKTQGKPTEKAHICSMLPHELRTLRKVGGELYRIQRVLASSTGMVE